MSVTMAPAAERAANLTPTEAATKARILNELEADLDRLAVRPAHNEAAAAARDAQWERGWQQWTKLNLSNDSGFWRLCEGLDAAEDLAPVHCETCGTVMPLCMAERDWWDRLFCRECVL